MSETPGERSRPLAENAFLDRTHFELDPEAFDRFEALLDDPPPPTEGLRRLLLRPAPWE